MDIVELFRNHFDKENSSDHDFTLTEYSSNILVGMDSFRRVCVVVKSSSPCRFPIKHKTQKMSIECNMKVCYELNGKMHDDMALLDTTEEGSGFQERLLELLGEQHQEDHGGVFTDFGYAELGGEIKDIYVCQSNETACFHRSDAPVMLEVRKGFFNDPSYDNDKTAVLNLPAADAGIWRAVEKVDAASVDECAFRCVDCLIPFLRDAINNAIDDEDGIEQADEFAKRLAQIEREWPESDMVKYKALLSVVDHPSLQDATRLMGEIDQYELRPEVAQTWGYYMLTNRSWRSPSSAATMGRL